MNFSFNEAFEKIKSGELTGKEIKQLKRLNLLNQLHEDGFTLMDCAIMYGQKKIEDLLKRAGAVCSQTLKPQPTTG